jgi:TonB family protein
MILLVDYEPRTATRVTEALAPLGHNVVVARDLEAAILECAGAEPALVLITSVLPRLKVEDAITQLRARAGLRTTPFLILMSGYAGDAPAVDGARYGAQGIVGKPFSAEDLAGQARALLASRGTAGQRTDSRVDVLEALRRSAGLDSGDKVTSEQLFGDLIGEDDEPSPAATQRIPVEAIRPAAPPATAAAKPAPGHGADPPKASPPSPAGSPDPDVTRTVETSLSEMLVKPARTARQDSAASVDDLLSQTLSGLEVRIPRTPARTPAPPAAQPPAAQSPATQPPAPDAPKAAATTRGPLPQGAPFGQYELMELIATGGMAEVYKARMRGVEGFQKIVAIKRILPHLTDNDEFVTMFIDEAKLAAQLQHPGIIHIYDLGKIEKSYYIAMEYIDGKDLRSILRQLDEAKARMPVPLVVFIASRLAAALDYAHRRRDFQGSAMALVHRDVSPQNVLISLDGDIKLCDFGIAKAASKASHTRAGALKGKLQYMSPEQAWGKDLDHRSDIFSLGLVLYEMLTGRKAFAGDSELSILEQVRSPRLTPPREIEAALPEELEKVVLKALREDREERYQTASALAADLESILQTLRPSPGAAELGAYLTKLVRPDEVSAAVELQAPSRAPAAPAPARQAATKPSRQPEPTAAPAPPPAAPATPVTTKAPEARTVPAPEPAAAPVVAPAAAVRDLELPEDNAAPPRRGAPVVPIAAAIAVAVLGVVLWLTLGRGHEPAGDAAEQPMAVAESPAGLADASQVVEAAVPADELPGPDGQVEAAAPLPTRAAQPTPQPTIAAAVVPTAAPTAVPEIVPQPTAVPATVEEPVTVPTPQPTLPPPTAVPTRAPVATAPPTVRQGDLVENPDVPPQPLTTPLPQYPPMALRQKVGGVVVLSALVDENGMVQEVRILRGVKPDLGLDGAAEKAVRGWRFRPATKDGVRVKTWYNTSIPFKP